MLDLEKMVNTTSGNTLFFCKPNMYIEIDELGEIVHTWNDLSKTTSTTAAETMKTLRGRLTLGEYKPWRRRDSE